MQLFEYIKKEETLNNLLVFFLNFILFGYPIVAVISMTTGLPSSLMSITYRACMSILGVVIIVISIAKRPKIVLTKGSIYLMIFWIIYGIALINDISIQNILLRGKSPMWLYSFIFGSSMVSFLTMAFAGRYIKINNATILKTMTVVVVCNVMILFYIMKTTGFSLNSFAQRMVIENEGGNAINAITIGITGLISITICSYYLFMIKKTNILALFTGIIGVLIGGANMMLGGSRGPMLSFAVLVVLMVFFYYYYRISVVKLLKNWLYIIIIGLIGFFVVLPRFSEFNFVAIDRIILFLEERGKGEKEVRDYEWESAINQFVANPIWGDKYLTDYDHFYPHNVFLEVLMTTGLVGGTFFFLGFFVFLGRMFKMFKLKDPYYFFILLLALCMVLSRITSGALHQAADLWLMLGLIVSIQIKRKGSITNNKLSIQE